MDFFQSIVKEEAEEDKIDTLETSIMGDEGCKVFIKEEELEEDVTYCSEKEENSTENGQVFLKEEFDEEKTDVECGPEEYGCEEVLKACR